MSVYFAAFITSFAITFMAIPSIIRIAEIKHLFDEPDERKTHKTQVPTLGGLAIFAGMIFSLTFWSTQKEIVELQYIISSIIILFFIGMKDDLFNLIAHKKLIGQLLASFILVHWAGIRITSFFGILGIQELTILQSYLFSVFTMVVITNSFNLIDGIDCLAGCVGFLAATTFGVWFFLADQTQYVVLSASLVGSLVAFLYYNRTPAKIFMGDTGSLIVGIVLSILAIKFIELNRVIPLDGPQKISKIPVVTIGILIIPLFDTLRVFASRMLQGKSPFAADRNHLHHLIIDLGFTHVQATSLLIIFNLCIVVFVFNMQKVRSELTLTLVLALCFMGSYFLTRERNRRKKTSLLFLSKAANQTTEKAN
ncbi:MAG: undecaprenyl/decaprenyl-phosphate alpha-N-acetylglucosaminyl 1-phosphate transferase [Bacteriovoracaceae bacterium]|nr:undecaprenyl/decaprenyl-phosphate alpha-N-acetylglucosaminyl 1-phosphate transferase [Bacteriovoracaceae bacterium]